MKRKIHIFIIFLCLILFSFNIFAEENPADMDFAENIGLNGIKENIPEELRGYFPEETFDFGNGTYKYKFGFSSVFSFLSDIFPDILRSALKNFGIILGLIVTASVFSLMSKTLENAALGEIFSFASLLCLAAAMLSIINFLLTATENFLSSLCVFMSALTPVMALLCAYGGNITSSAVTAANVAFILTVMETVISQILFPAMRICFSVSVSAALSKSFNLKGISDFIKNTLTAVLVFMTSILGLITGYQNIIAKSADSVAQRSVKFAAGNFIPIIGSSLSEAVSTVFSAVSSIKNTLGAISCIVIISMLAPIILKLIFHRLLLLFSANIAKSLGMEKEGDFIKESSSYIGFATALCAASSVLFLFAVGLFFGSGAV